MMLSLVSFRITIKALKLCIKDMLTKDARLTQIIFLGLFLVLGVMTGLYLVLVVVGVA